MTRPSVAGVALAYVPRTWRGLYGSRLMGDPIPDDPARRAVERQDAPRVANRVLGEDHALGFHVQIGCRLRHRRDRVHAVAPDDRARMRETWNRDAPSHVPPRGGVPFGRGPRVIRNAGRPGSAKRRPVSGGRLGAGEENERGNEQSTAEWKVHRPAILAGGVLTWI